MSQKKSTDNSIDKTTDGNSVEGACFCGEVRFQIDLPTLFCGHCHCSMCRRPHGASYVTWAGVGPDHFRITQGADLLRTFTSSTQGRRQFCDTCGTQLFCWHETASGETKMIDVTLASLEAPIDRPPQGHYYYDSKAAWTTVNDDLPKFGGESGSEPLT